VAPRDELERRLAALWEELLGVRPIGVHDRFFDIGGDSFLAVRLMIRVQQALGRSIPVAALFAADTIDGLARAIRDTPSHSASPLVCLSSGDGVPFFCVHPIGGHVLCYVDLARSLGTLRPFYGIQAQGLQGEMTPCADVVAMAAHYLKAIRSLQPRGPYWLGGWSMGGTVAFEIAQQLHAQDEEVARLVLIDTETTAVARATDRAVRDPELVNEIPRDIDPRQLSHLLSVITNNNRALKAYRERRYSGGLTLLRASQQPPGRSHDLGWNELVTGGVDVAIVPGDHYSIFQRPSLGVLAAHLRRSLVTEEA
jgi:thioesterase domain-containing protein